MNTVLILIISLMSLIWAANHLITGATNMAVRLKITPFIMGLTLVALVSSVPELVFFLISSLKKKNSLIISNAIGFSIANIALILSFSALIKPITRDYSVLLKTQPIIIILMLFAYRLIINGVITKIDGCLFLIACSALLAFFIYLYNQEQARDLFFNQFKLAASSNQTLKANIFNILLGLLIMPIGTRYLQSSTSELAISLGMSEQAISLSLVALCATFPALITAFTAVYKNQDALAAGIIIGTVIYSLLLILAIPYVFTYAKANPAILWRDIPIIFSLIILLLFLNYQYKEKVSLLQGGILMVIYFSYVISLIRVE